MGHYSGEVCGVEGVAGKLDIEPRFGIEDSRERALAKARSNFALGALERVSGGGEVILGGDVRVVCAEWTVPSTHVRVSASRVANCWRTPVRVVEMWVRAVAKAMVEGWAGEVMGMALVASGQTRLSVGRAAW